MYKHNTAGLINNIKNDLTLKANKADTSYSLKRLEEKVKANLDLTSKVASCSRDKNELEKMIIKNSERMNELKSQQHTLEARLHNHEVMINNKIELSAMDEIKSLIRELPKEDEII